MKITTVKTITISDLVQWQKKGELSLSPKYQRNSVWNENAKSYLIDTIVRGLPIPPIFLRQSIDVPTMSTFREIIDGQQRVRTIISFVVEQSFVIKKSHNVELGGLLFSELDDEQQRDILSYEISAEVVSEKDDSLIYDMFARLNSNNIVLNKQEIRNAMYWGDFKVLVYRISKKSRDFFYNERIFADKDFSRMKDSELINSIIIMMIDGIVGETPTIIDNYYKQYDKDNLDVERIESQFDDTFKVVNDLYNNFYHEMIVFHNKNYFFTLFCVLYHQLFGIKDFDGQRLAIFSNANINNEFKVLVKAVSSFLSDLSYITSLPEGLETFLLNHRSRTTNKQERYERIYYFNRYICEHANKN